jgi:hypothetical protein
MADTVEIAQAVIGKNFSQWTAKSPSVFLTRTNSRCAGDWLDCGLRRRRYRTKPRVAALRRAPWVGLPIMTYPERVKHFRNEICATLSG